MRSSLVLLLLALTVACSEPENSAPERPESEPAQATTVQALPRLPPEPAEDVVLITIDTLRADVLGFMGHESVATPALDRLAAGGFVFDDARAHNVVTLPSHANILTGLLPYEHGVRDNSGFVLPDSIPTAATIFAESGFATAAFVAAYPLDARYGLSRGFDLYDDDFGASSGTSFLDGAERSGDEVLRAALEWWQGQGERRRFAWLHLYDPHAPYLPPAPYRDRHPTEPYLGEVEAVDSYLAPLLDKLTAAPRRTLVIVTSDHGEALGDHDELTHGLFAYEATLKVPLVVWGTGIPAGRTNYPARHVDLLPTLVRAAGLEGPPGISGRSLFYSNSPAPAPGQYFESLTSTFTSGFAPLRGVVEGGFKFISLPLPELYDLSADPGESVNRVDSERERVRTLLARLPEESVWPPKQGEISRESESALRSLGYLTGGAALKESYGPEDDPKVLIALDRKVHEVVDLYHRGELQGAEALAREVVAERPEMEMAWSYLGQVLLQAGRLEDAIEVMRQADRQGVARDALKRQLGLSLAEAGRYSEALSALEAFGDSDDPDVLKALGLVLSEAGDQAAAKTVLERALAADPRQPVVLENLALVALRKTDWESARKHSEAALELDATLGPSWNYLGTARYNLGNPRGAVDAWARSVEVDPEGYDALFNLALVAGQIGDTPRAIQALQRFVATAPAARYAADLERARGLLRQLGAGH